jgi:hypothetical protein
VRQELLRCSSWLAPPNKRDKNKGEVLTRIGEVHVPLNDEGLHPRTVINVTQRWRYRQAAELLRRR